MALNWRGGYIASILRARREITASGRLLIGRYGMVPRAVELLASDVDHLDLFVSDLHAFRLEVAVDLAAYLEVSFGRRDSMSLRSSRRYDSFVSRRILRCKFC